MRNLDQRERSGSTPRSVSPALYSSNSNCPKPKARRSNKLKGSWWIEFPTPMNRINLVQSSRATRIREARPASGNGHSKVASTVQVRVEDLVIPTYLPAPPDKNPMFLEKRVYQGSSG